MTTAETTTPATRARWTGATRPLLATLAAVGLALIVTLGVVLHQYGPGRMWLGYLVGVALAIATFAVASWRVRRHPDRAMPMERVLVHAGDERDDDVLTRALAVVGIVAMPATAVATVIIAAGAPAVAVSGGLVWGLLVLLGVTFAVINRHR